MPVSSPVGQTQGFLAHGAGFFGLSFFFRRLGRLVQRMARSRGYDSAQLLAAPHVTLQMLGACQDLSGAPGELREIVLQDSALCARLVATAVKTCPECLDPAAPVSSALAGLGRPLIRSLALQAAKQLIDTPLDATQTQFLRELWFYSQAAGSLCRSLAEAIAYPDLEEAQLTGMMLNLGMLALFSAHHQDYPRLISGSLGNSKVLGEEQAGFETDHCRTGAALISAWRLDSFMAEAIRYLYLDPRACRDSAVLVRIARFAFELCKSPLTLLEDSAALGKELLDLDSERLAVAFERAAVRYRALVPFDSRQDECSREVDRICRRMNSLIFSLAELEGIRSRLAEQSDRGGTLVAARALYLHYSPAREILFFLAAPGGEQFEGSPASGQSRRLRGLSTSLAGSNLLAEALRSGKLRHSFDVSIQPLSVFDRQLLELCGTPGMAILPLRLGAQLPGAVVLGLEGPEEIETLGLPSLHQLGRAVANTFAVPADTPPLPPGEPSILPRQLAHEIRTPLAVINNYMKALGLLLEGGEHVEAIAAMENEVRRIGDILAYFTEPGEPLLKPAEEPSPAPENLVHSVAESLAATLFAPKHLEITTDCAPAILPLAANPLVIRQILVNLLKNAAEALADGGRIVVATRESLTSAGERQVIFSVEDNGPGIEAAILENLFSPVTSTKGEGHAGLGLHIVKGLADDICARVNCQSTPGHGTRFELIIPRAPKGVGSPSQRLTNDQRQ